MVFYNNMANSFEKIHNPNNNWDTRNNIEAFQENNNIQSSNSTFNINTDVSFAEQTKVFKEEEQRINGRVNIIESPPQESFPLFFQEGPRTQKYTEEVLNGIQNITPLSRAYFSKQNLDDLQNMIRFNIWILSENKYIISRQSDVDLHLVMRSMFLQHSQNRPTEIKKQIKYLNSLVLNWCIPRIFSQVEQFLAYRKNVSGLNEPIKRSVDMSITGTKTLEIKNFM